MMTSKTGMDQVTDFFYNYAWCGWMGIIFSECGVSALTWRWWLFFIPLIFFVEMAKKQYLRRVLDDAQKLVNEAKEEQELKDQRTKDLDIFR